MQPNNQQGLYRPGQAQPGQMGSPPQPGGISQSPQPAPVIQPTGVDSAAIQAVLDEPTASQNVTLPIVEPQSSPGIESKNEDEYYEEDEQSEEPVVWSAHEFIHRDKGTGWFALFVTVIVALIGVSVWTSAWSFTVLIVVIAFVIVVYSRRPPRDLNYSLNNDGLTIDNTLHEFENFKSFGVIRDGEEFSVMLIPTQRFQPGITVYFPEELGEAIVDMFGSRLPMKDLHLDLIDRIVRMLRL